MIIAFFRSTNGEGGGGYEHANIYYVHDSPISNTSHSAILPLQIYCRLGYPSFESLKKLGPMFKSFTSLGCESCKQGKHHQVTFMPRNNNRCLSSFVLVHSDVRGPCRTTLIRGFKDVVTFVYDYARVRWLFLVKYSLELVYIRCSFSAEVKIQYCSIRRRDNSRQ